MKQNLFRRCTTATLATLASVALLCLPSVAMADNISPVGFLPTTTVFGVADAVAGYTNSTTTASDITGATLTIPKSTKPLVGNTSGGPTGIASALRLCYYADAGKATSTTGTINLVVNGVTIANAARQINFNAARGDAAACYVMARPVATSFVVKLQGVSGDTAAFTVYNAQLTAEVLYFN
ncbi:hypothetical protein [Novosphingobium sp.]|uniref:hypothetical protein n=1 Tax=Novosphingobium sp. TaxID=1874826 RepID=UPI003B51B8C3